MGVFLLLLITGLWALLILIASIRPNPSSVSRFELNRRAKTSERSQKLLHRDEQLGTINLILQLKSMALIIIITLIAVLLTGLLAGVLIALAIAAATLWFSTFNWISRIANTIYISFEPKILDAIGKTNSFWRHIHTDSALRDETFHKIDSKEHLIYLLERSAEVFDLDERRRLVKSLSFNSRKVSEIMVPKKKMKTVSKDEFLGPLVLDELHALGYRQLPVIGKDINHIVGILSLERLLSLDIRRSLTAEKAMQKNVQYISENDTLKRALDILMKSGQWLAVVVGDDQETVGLVGLRDIIDALTGDLGADDTNEL